MEGLIVHNYAILAFLCIHGGALVHRSVLWCNCFRGVEALKGLEKLRGMDDDDLEPRA